jgi:hypothetical protein
VLSGDWDYRTPVEEPGKLSYCINPASVQMICGVGWQASEVNPVTLRPIRLILGWLGLNENDSQSILKP